MLQELLAVDLDHAPDLQARRQAGPSPSAKRLDLAQDALFRDWNVLVLSTQLLLHEVELWFFFREAWSLAIGG